MKTVNIPTSSRTRSVTSTCRKITGLFASAFSVLLLFGTCAHVAEFRKPKDWRSIAFLRVLVAMNVAEDVLPWRKKFGGVSKCTCPRDIL